ncbi:MAG: helix-turn-helix transcriptional regulator, partial [Spirochaetota bacterium]
ETDAGLQYAIVSPQGRAAATAGPVTAEFATRFHARHLPGSAERIEHEGGPLIVVDHLSPETGWAVYAFADLASITAPARTLQRVTALVIAAVAVVALGLILLAVRLNYHPVRSLLDVLSRAFGGETSIDTFDDARLTLSELIRHDRALERRLEREAGPAREGVVNQLIAGTPTTSLDLEAVWIGASPLPGAPRFVTLAIRATAASGGSGETVAALARMARACSEPPNARWLFRAGVFREPTAAVVQFTADPRVPDDQVARRLSCAALAAVRSARGVAGVNVGAVVGVGVVVESLDEVSVSYQEARRAYDQHFVLGVDRVIAPADVAQPRWDRAPVVLDPLALRQAVLSSRADEASQYLLGIGDELRRAGVPAYIARGLCVEVCRVVTDLLVELGDSPAADGEPGCARRVESYATFDAFARDVASVIARIGAYHRSRHDREAVRLVQLVRREIDEHLGDPQFSIQSLAEAHHLSPPALSNLFRRYAGTGANAYLTRRRIDAARALLRTTSLPLKDVAAQVGYQNVSSFIRRYRSLTGETPGDYRVRTAS